MKILKAALFAFSLLFSAIAFAGQVNINTANESQLATNINGVGIKKASAIVAYRENNGPFKKVDDLVKVKGIGFKILEKNRANIVIADAE